jgi:hypothetical protein
VVFAMRLKHMLVLGPSSVTVTFFAFITRDVKSKLRGYN